MKKIATLAEAEELLHEMKVRILKEGILFMNQRFKNAQTLADFGILKRPRGRSLII